MDLMDVLLQTGLFTGVLVVYLIVFKKYPKKRGHYAQRSWNYPLKWICARWAVRSWKAERAQAETSGDEEFSIKATASDGSTLLLALRKDGAKAELSLFVKLTDETTFTLPRHPDTLIGAWQQTEGGWRAGGLTLQRIDADRLRILFNGLLRRDGNKEQHVVFSFIWTDASRKARHPQDWSDCLAAQALATERWTDSRWQELLDHCEESSSTQWGCLQGQLQAFDPEGAVQSSEWLRLRGARVDAVKGEVEPRRAVELVLVARDGSMVQLKAASYKALTHVRSGNVRFPDSSVHSIESTDFRLVDFPEYVKGIPDAYVINVSTARGSLRLVVRPDRSGGGRLLGGAPYRRQTTYLTVGGSVGGEPATGLLLLASEPEKSVEPRVPLAPPPTLRFTPLSEAKPAGYCVSLDEPAAACEGLVGGKGASLSLLTSVQKQHGYRVPPGFCLTTHALDRHLEANPELAAAIRDIQACNEDYKEQEFKDKCSRAVKLFESTQVAADVMEEVRSYQEDLIRKANKQNLGPDLRFAVRSSAVGEDGEALSAAGQNTTVLGCAAGDVLKAVQKCWGSMFAFTSANYRRINGQKCRCDGGVVVQAIVKAEIAGVLFTRYPDNGDPTRMLVTASYGLGESVVSGSVEPDTFIVRRSEDTTSTDLHLASTHLGSKAQRVGPDGSVEDVPEGQRAVASLSEEEVLKLARAALALERLWAAPRDIEWAVCEKEIFLLQARPITSLQRWSEQELLHELDTPVMSEDTLISFANVGEVVPKPISPMSQDIVTKHLSKTMQHIVSGEPTKYVTTCGITHHRLYMDAYNSTYRVCPPKVDVGLRMTEMSLHGHAVADEHVLSVAHHIHPPKRMDKPRQMLLMLKSLIFSKWYTRDSVKRASSFDVDKFETDDPLTLLTAVEAHLPKYSKVLENHMWTSTASSASQIIAMSILLEGAQDFTPEQCNEIGMLLSSGETVSADVPLALDRLSRSLAASGRAEEFRRQQPEKALYWLEDNLPEVFAEVQKFLEQHGHRALMEFDVATKPWALQPEQLMKVLQNTPAPSNADAPKAKSDAEVIAGLTTPKKSSTRKVLAWMLPLCRRMVVNRECTKSQLILSIHKFRLAIRRLGALLVRGWLLPDLDTVFYFTLHELRRYLETRDPVLLRKATQRRQFWGSWGQHKFAELNTGWPQPQPRATPRLEGAGARLSATPVCSGAGDVVARAAVIKDLADIGELQQGDILITHSTDIGWSPYFPLITGIVTELGGLISHGAVIAREYGLPCVVGAAGATDLFQTGDLVRLSGATGVLEKVQRTADDEDTEAFVVV